MNRLEQDLKDLDDEERLMVFVYIWLLQDKREGGVQESVLRGLRGLWASLYYVFYLSKAQLPTELFSPSSTLMPDI